MFKKSVVLAAVTAMIIVGYMIIHACPPVPTNVADVGTSCGYPLEFKGRLGFINYTTDIFGNKFGQGFHDYFMWTNALVDFLIFFVIMFIVLYFIGFIFTKLRQNNA